MELHGSPVAADSLVQVAEVVEGAKSVLQGHETCWKGNWQVKIWFLTIGVESTVILQLLSWEFKINTYPV